MEQQSQEFKSDFVTFTVERKPDCIVEYKVNASPEIVKKARGEAIRSISKEVSIPGFRKGRAPEHLIAKKFAHPLEERWQKTIADEAFHECQKLAHIPLVSNDTRVNFNMAKHSLEDGAEMTFAFETEPLIPEIKLDNIEIEEVKRDVIDEEKVAQILHDIQMFFAEWEKISDRNVQDGDYAVIDVDIIEEEPPKKALTNARFEVSKKKMASWMYELILDMKIGEAREGISKPDDEAPEEEKNAMPPKKVRMTLKAIEQPKLPAIDDALAQKMGAKNTQDMKENLEKLLNKQADEHVQRSYRDQISNFLLNTYKFDLPKTLLQKEVQFRIRQLVSDPSFQQKMLGMNDAERRATIKEIEEKGEQAVRLFYISRQIIQDNKISVSPSEVHQEIKTPMDAMFSEHSDHYTAKEQSQEQKAIAMSRLILSKAEDFLISKAKIVSSKPKKKEAAPKHEASKEEETSEKEAPVKKTTAKKATGTKKASSDTKKS